jgi:asparagine synthase (glutamine-hydrolysing)
MCGIVGVADLQGRDRLPSAETFDRMVDSMTHRGPDGRGTARFDGVLLGHRRLAILDPTPAGRQPMHHAARGVSITYNGEIYNFRELREELEGRGHTFQTRTDTEVLLAAYLEWGTSAAERLNGIFALAIWDEPRRRLWLARDHLGVKPLYYGEHDGVLRFASEMKAILADPEAPREPDLEAVDAYLTHCYVPVPLASWRGFQQLPPGHHLLVEDGRVRAPVRYWSPTVRERDITEAQALEELAAGLERATRMQMVSDVPLGAFLSGGLDSASLVAEMTRARDGVKTFSIGFEEASFDESDDARATAAIVGSEHHARRLSLDLAEGAERFSRLNDDLHGDSSVIAVQHLCQLAREQVTVALSGDGADELLAGYPTYIAGHLATAWRRVPRVLRRLAHVGASQLPVSTERYNQRDFALRFLEGAERGRFYDHAGWRRYFTPEDKRTLLRPEARRFTHPLAPYARAMAEAGEDATLLKRMLYADLSFYLPSDMLVKVDRASMAHSLEVRVPFLDPDLVDLCLSFPTHLLFGLKTKRLLREHLAQRVSPEIGKRKKRGFNVPIGAALKHELGDLLLDAVRARAFREGGPLDPDGVEQALAAHRAGEVDLAAQLYVCLVLALWWREWVQPS